MRRSPIPLAASALLAIGLCTVAIAQVNPKGQSGNNELVALKNFLDVFIDSAATTFQKDRFVGKSYEGVVTVSDVRTDDWHEPGKPPAAWLLVKLPYNRELKFYPVEPQALSQLRKGETVHVVGTLRQIFKTEYLMSGGHETAVFNGTQIEAQNPNR